MADKKLFTEFPPVSTEQWEEVITKDLKGADYEKKLVWKTNDGISVRPYYRSENLKSLKYLGAKPGEYPFVRGVKENNDWLVRQNYCACADVNNANAQALDGLMKGVTSLGFCVGGKLSDEEFGQLMKGIHMDAVEVNFTGCKCSSAELISQIANYAKKNNAKLENVCGSTDYDPLKKLTLAGNICEEKAFEKVKEQIEAAKDLKRWKTVGISGNIIHNSGSTIVQELAFALAMGNEYLS
ncbi:MAG: acyl-CoA mutase large subunit family protein, partial [Prevotellaceae bacterium]|nr:acyl-CoA mutase large subunit family protein [Prevotellaceae bacterium]